MKLQRYLHSDFLPLPLIAVMVLTRFHHFGDVLHLPDASLAVFFFAGFYRHKIFLGFLLVLAGLIDYLAIVNGTSAWCISPAYVFLIPTYAVMWLAGRYCLNLTASWQNDWIRSAALFGFLALATTVAFIISNDSFYLFSGRFPSLSWSQYLARIAQYYPPYISSTLLYGIVGYTLMKLIKAALAVAAVHKTAK